MPRHEHTPLSSQRYADLRAQFHEDEGNYEIIRGDQQAVRGQSGVWDTDYTLSKYVAETDKMIGILDGSIDERDLYHPDATPDDIERANQSPDTVIWLDKSARPVSWFVDGFWDQFAQDGTTRPGDINSSEWQESVRNLPTRLDGQNILVVDEVKNKGATLSIALQLIKRAIPSATVSGEYFWQRNAYQPKGVPQDEFQMESAPVWYDAKNAYGRGVGDISAEYYRQLPDTPENRKLKLGWIALSAPHFDPDTYETIPDEKADKLKQDIAYMTYAVADHKIPRTPSRSRDIDDVDAIIGQYDMNIRDMTAYRIKRDAENQSQK